MFDKLTDRALDAFYLTPQIHFDCDREMVIENCRRIEEYNEVFMQLVSGKLCIQIWGSGLRAYDFRTHGLIVRGKIERVEFIERSARRDERSAERLCEDKR